MAELLAQRMGPATKLVAGLVALGVCSALATLVLIALFPAVALGWHTDAVGSGSMGPLLRTGDALVTQPYDGRRLGEGAIVVFRDGSGRRISHRIVAVNDDGTYTTRGDANPKVDSTPVRADAIVGVGRMVVPRVALPLVWADEGDLLHLWVLAGAVVLLIGMARWSSPAPAHEGRPEARRPRVRIALGAFVPRTPAIRMAAIALVPLVLGFGLLAPGRALARFSASTGNSGNSFAAASTWGIAVAAVSHAATPGKATALSWSHTVPSGSNRVIVVALSLRKNNVSISNVTYGGVGGFTLAGEAIGGGADHRVQFWYKLAPPVGTGTVSVTTGGDLEFVGAATSLTGVHQTNPFRSVVPSAGASATPSVTATSATGELVLGALSSSGDTGSVTLVAGAERWRNDTGVGDSNVFAAGSSGEGAPSVTLSWSMGNSNKWAMGALAVKPA